MSQNDTTTEPLYFDRAGNPISIEQWVEYRQDQEYRAVARDTVGDFDVITVWMGIDQGMALEGELPVIYGTIVRDRARGEYDDSSERFSTSEAEARAIHEQMLAGLSAKRHSGDKV